MATRWTPMLVVLTFAVCVASARAATLVGTFPGNDFFSEGSGRCTVCDIVGNDNLFLSARLDDGAGEGPDAAFYSVSFATNTTAGSWTNSGAPNDPLYFAVKAGPNFVLYAVDDPASEDWDTFLIPNPGGQIPGLSHISFYVPEPSTALLVGLGLLGLAASRRRR